MEELSGAPGADLTSRLWWIDLGNWVLKEGTYTNVAVGERRQFALELGYRRAARLAPVAELEECTPHVMHTGRRASYDVVGEVLVSTGEPHRGVVVLDCGLRAYIHGLVPDSLEPPAAGDWLTGEISLGVDYFAYVDELACRPGMPALIYTWRIEEILLDLTPQIVVEPGHPLHEGLPRTGPQRVRDGSREGWRSVARTSAWEEDGDYRLGCRLEAVAPVSTMAVGAPGAAYGPLPG